MKNKLFLGLGVLLMVGMAYALTVDVNADICGPQEDAVEDVAYDDCVEQEITNNAGMLRKYMKVTAPDITDQTLGRYGQSGSGVYEITWTGPMFVQTVNLLYTLDDGRTYTEIAAGVENTGSFAWTLPEINSDHVKVRVSGMGADGYNYGSDLSNAFFSIRNAA